MTTTAMVVLAFMIGLGLYDVYAVGTAKGDVSTSVSRFVQKLGFKSPMFVLVFGILVGHWFFYMTPECDCPAPQKVEQHK